MLTPLASKLLGWFTKGIEDLQNNKLYDSSLQLPNHVQMKTCKHDLLFMWLHNWSDYSDNILREDSPISLQESVSQNKHADQEIKESLSEYLSQVNNGSLHISHNWFPKSDSWGKKGEQQRLKITDFSNQILYQCLKTYHWYEIPFKKKGR